jgi:hypothetical protein
MWTRITYFPGLGILFVDIQHVLLALSRTTSTEKKMQTCNCAPKRIQPTITTRWAAEDTTHLRSCSHCDCCYHCNLDKTDENK